MLHGHWDPELVVKLQDFEPLIGVPELFCAPDTVAVYVVPAASGLSGVNVATVSPPLKPTEPLTAPPPEAVTVNDTVFGTTACENVAVGIDRHRVARRPIVGVTLDTTGGVAARRLACTPHRPSSSTR